MNVPSLAVEPLPEGDPSCCADCQSPIGDWSEQLDSAFIPYALMYDPEGLTLPGESLDDVAIYGYCLKCVERYVPLSVFASRRP